MPCHVDPPSYQQEQRQREAQLLLYLFKKLDRNIPYWVTVAADEEFCQEKRSVAWLCETLKNMAPATREVVVYNAHDPMARKLADFWDEHQKVDAERERREQRMEKDKKIKKAAVAKLTPEERRVLGVR